MSPPRRSLIEESHSLEVAVVGGGLAGVCAAIASARGGAKTALVQNRPVLGGNSSSEIRVPISGAGSHNALAAETGIVHELILEERTRNYEPVRNSSANHHWDLTLYEACLNEPELSLFLNTNVYETRLDGNRISEVVGLQSGTEKRITFKAAYFIDCTGDGTVGMQAGVPYRVGQEARSEYGESLAPEEAWDHTLGNSLFFHAIDVGRPVDYSAPDWAYKFQSEEDFKFRPLSPYCAGHWWIEMGWPHDTIADNEILRDKLLPYVLGVWDFVKNQSRGREAMRNYALDWISMVPGKRESRRFVGAHVMTQGEIQARTLYPDRIAYGGWIIDDHLKEGITDLTKKPSFDDVPQVQCVVAPFSVTLSSLYAHEVPNLLFAGRDVSVSRLVFNSLRVMATLGVIGQGAGTAAAVCASSGRDPGQLTDDDIDTVQQTVLRDDGYIPRLPNHDPTDLARNATVTASSEAGLPSGVAADHRLSLATGKAQLVPISTTSLSSIGVYLKNMTADTAPLWAKLIPATDCWDVAALDKGDAFANATAELTPHQEGWLDFPFDIEIPDAPQLFWLQIDAAPGVEWALSDPSAPGLCAAEDRERRWWFGPRMFSLWATLSIRTDPPTRPHSPVNVINGVSRPECWPNLWISSPDEALPQTLDLTLPQPAQIGEIHLAFDTNVNRTPFLMEPLSCAPECVRDYTILVEGDAGWEPIVEVRGNHQRRRKHTFTPQETSRVRVRVDATNDVAEARLFEVRLYGM